MPRALAIDDDPIISKMITAALTRQGYEVVTASDGLKGLALVKAEHPDIIITDVMMPGIDGYEVTRRLRRDPNFAHTPILILTSQSDLEEKLRAFEVGADDHMSKPFEPAELAARLTVLLRRAESVKAAQSASPVSMDKARLIAVHSLRGGVGCSSLAVNLAVGLAQLWEAPTLLMDLVFMAGQAALMLNTPLKRTWADLTRFDVADVDIEVLKSIIGQHPSKLDVIAAPTSPTETEELKANMLNVAFNALRPRYEYIVADLAHDFNDITITALDAADLILLPLAPEMSSARAAAVALETYTKLGYSSDKVRLVLNWTFEHKGLARKSIETALHFPISLVLPFAPDRFVSAINHGRPLLFDDPADPVAALIEDFAFRLSKNQHQTIPPAVPSAAWQRVAKRVSPQLAGARR